MSSVDRIQDSVHGLMEFSGSERAVLDALDTPELQRLRRIRHLGLAHLVFPSAEHSRLSHVLGASHLAIRFAKRLATSCEGFVPKDLSPNEGHIRDVALAALCHDIGEGPTSHAWDNFVVGKFDHEVWSKSLGVPCDKRIRGLKWHELVTQAILNNPEGRLHKLLETFEGGSATRIRSMLLGDHYLTYLPMILSSDIDVDRSDYILRDGLLTGVRYGKYDLEWLISTIEVGTYQGRLVFGFDKRKALKVIEQFIIARRAMYDTVYHHKTVQGAEAMIGLLFEQLAKAPDQIESTTIKEGRAFRAYAKVFRGEVLSLDDILTLDDHSLSVLIWELAESDAEPAISDLCRRLVTRDLFKSVGGSEEVQTFFQKTDSHERLRAVLKKTVHSEYWYRVVPTERRFVSATPEKRVLLIDMSKSDRPADPVTESLDMKELITPLPTLHRLFVPREACEDVRALLLT